MVGIITLINDKIAHLNKLRGFHSLTFRGFLVHDGGEKGVSTQKFDWKNALIDATITSSVTFFSTIGAGHAAGLGEIGGIMTATIAALTQFFVFLALKRGIIQQKEN